MPWPTLSVGDVHSRGTRKVQTPCPEDINLYIDGAVDGARLHNVYGGKDNFDKKNGKWGGLNVDHAANAFFSLHKQHPSAWTHEIELRPWVENW